MNDLASPHDNIEKVSDKLLPESLNILGSTLDLYQAEEIISEGKDGTFDIFGQSLSDMLYPNFDQHTCHQMSADASFSDSQMTSSNIQNRPYDCKSKLDFSMFNKVWPDQLDILAGPLLEDDEDGAYNNCDTSHKYSLNSKGVNLMSDYEQALLLNNYMRTEIGTKKKMFHFDSISCKRNIELKFGSIVHISKDEDTGEEIDVVTIDEDSSADNVILDTQCSFQGLLAEGCNDFSPQLVIGSCNTNASETNVQSSLLGNPTDLPTVSELMPGIVTAITEDVPKVVLEAPDLDSLLEKFEATEGVTEAKMETTDCHKNRLADRKNTPCASPKDSCTTSIIKKIKSSTVPSRSTIMISHETILKSNSPNRIKRQCSSSVTSKRCAVPANKASKESAATCPCKDYNAVNSSDDHDYCFPSCLNSTQYYNKIPEYLTELKPRKNSDHDPVLRKTFSRKGNTTIPLEDAQNVTIENSFPKSSNGTQPENGNTTSHSFQKETIDICSSLSPTRSKIPLDEIVSDVTNESSANEECQISESTEVKKPHLSELSVLSNSPKCEPSSVSSTDFLIKHDQYSANEISNSINSSPSCSPPSRWHQERSRSRSPPFGRYGSKVNRVRNGSRQNFGTWEYKEKLKQIEERRVLYVGNIPEGMTRAELRERFGKFGPIFEVSVHIRDFDDNYAFVTYCNRNDAYKAVEHGNDDPNLPRFELSFGGRRQFCKVKYADLDSQYDYNEKRKFRRNSSDVDFDSLLKDVKAQFKARRPTSQS